LQQQQRQFRNNKLLLSKLIRHSSTRLDL
jgi:hypothetical protein